jgi:Flp pilus assembly protein protease CpaA
VGAGGAAWATATDVRSARISNRTVGAIALIGLLLRATSGGLASVTWGALGGCVAAILAMAPYRTARISGGDVKLLTAFAVLIGPIATVYMAAVAVALAAVSSRLLGRRVENERRTVTATPLAPAISLAAATGAAIAATI